LLIQFCLKISDYKFFKVEKKDLPVLKICFAKQITLNTGRSK